MRFEFLLLLIYLLTTGAGVNPPIHSLREFCDLSMPVIMFDKDDNYSVMRLEEVSSSNRRRALFTVADSTLASSAVVRSPDAGSREAFATRRWPGIGRELFLLFWHG